MTDQKKPATIQKTIAEVTKEGTATPSDTKDKGKAVALRSQNVDISDINPKDPNQILEVKVYLKWTARNVPDPTPRGLCFILLDRRGNAIQANVDLRDLRQFETALQVNVCYRIQGFGTKRTETWQRTLENNITLMFGRYTRTTYIENEGFPDHYFSFIAYSELARRVEMQDSILTDYIGIIRAVGAIKEFGRATTNRILRKNVEIQNLNGNTVTLSFWNDMATAFEQQVVMPHEQPTILAVSSCIVKVFAGSMQLSATPATHFYFNPNVPDANHIREVYNEFLGPVMSIPLTATTFQTEDQPASQEPIRIAELLEINPDSFPLQQRFTVEAVITSIDETKGWYMDRCRTCGQRIEDDSPHWQCHQPGVEIVPNYSYSVKAIIADMTGSLLMTCYSPQAHSLFPPITEMLSYVPDTDPYKVPPIIKDLENTNHRFVLRLAKGSRRRSLRFILDGAEDAALPALATTENVDSPPTMSLIPTTETGASSSVTTGTSATNTPPTEISTKTFTPPPTSADPQEKSHTLPAKDTDSVRKQLFPDLEHEQESPATKKSKKEEEEQQQ